MGRRSGGGSRAGGRAAPRRASSSRAAPRQAPRRPAPPPARAAAPSKTAPAKATGAAPPAKATPGAPQQGSAMGGFMSNVASTGLGVMAGRALDRTFFGGGSGGGSEPAPAEGSEYEMAPDAYGADSFEAPDEAVCAREVLEFKKCLQRTGTDMQACQWNYDILLACQKNQAQTGFADAGRF